MSTNAANNNSLLCQSLNFMRFEYAGAKYGNLIICGVLMCIFYISVRIGMVNGALR